MSIHKGSMNVVLLCVPNAELEKLDENVYERPSEDVSAPKRYYFENLKISLPQVKLSVFTSHKLPPDLKVTRAFLRSETHTNTYTHTH